MTKANVTDWGFDAETPDDSASQLNVVWGVIRALLPDEFRIRDTISIVGLAGLDVTKLREPGQAPGKTFSSRTGLMAAMDPVFSDMPATKKRHFLTIVCEEILQRRPGLENRLRGYLERLGWQLRDGKLVPIELLDLSDLPHLPVAAQDDLVKASIRLRDGDLSGAISAVCGAVDTVTAQVYREKSLGDPGDANSFHERVKRSLKAREVLSKFESELLGLGWPPGEVKMFMQNLEGSLNGAAFVLQKLRSNMGDVHGTQPVLEALVFDSIKWAALIVRMLA